MKLSIVEHPKFGEIRMQMIKNEPYFCVNDVCGILGYKNANKALKDHCREKGVTKCYTLTEGGNQDMNFINEGNLYRLILKSNMPAAEKFESWVCDEVLPSLRRYGKYVVPGSEAERKEQVKLDKKENQAMLNTIAYYLTDTDRRIIAKKLFVDEWDVMRVLTGYREDVTVLLECIERSAVNSHARRKLRKSEVRQHIIALLRGEDVKPLILK